MKFTDYLRRFLRNYCIIFAIIVMCITILSQIFTPNKVFELSDIFIYMVCALIGDLPSLVFYSRKEISEKELKIRTIIYFVVLETALLFSANVMGWVTGMLNTSILAAQIAGIYFLARFVSGRDDRVTANKINEKLKKLKEEIKKESEKESEIQSEKKYN